MIITYYFAGLLSGISLASFFIGKELYRFYIKNKVQKKQVTIREPNSSNYITNKYFKDYKEPGVIEEPPKPMTKEEYRQMLIQDYIKRQEAQRRIAQIKSKKLLFHTNNINIAQNPNQMPRDMNKLFKTFR